MERGNSGVPFVVKIRTYLFHIIIFAIVLIADVFIFQFFAENATVACSEIKRVNDAPHNEIVFSYEPTGDDSFYYIKQYHATGAKNINVSCDILMVTDPARTYKNNDIYFEGTLGGGACAVSGNLAREYGLNTGDVLKISGTDKTFKVERLITAQTGINKEYRHEGIVVLGYDGELLDKTYSYVSFTTDGDSYPSLIDLVYIGRWKEESSQDLLTYAGIALAAFCAAMAVCERFLFTSRRQDYRVLVSLGKSSPGLFGVIWAENALKYLLPPFVAAAIYSVWLAGFGTMYLITSLYLPCAAVAAITAYSLILVRRYYRCQVKR